MQKVLKRQKSHPQACQYRGRGADSAGMQRRPLPNRASPRVTGGRSLCWVLLFLTCWLGLLSTATAGVQLDGRDYTRLSEWAKSRDLGVAWVKRDKILQVTSGANRITLFVETRDARVNGVQVWLCHPVLLRRGVVYLASLDMAKTLEPLLFPARLKSGEKLGVICLDPGHGGRDPGNRAGTRQEKTYTLLLAQEVQSILKAAGLKVIFTRTSDIYLDPETRPQIARSRGADLFVSLHFNATPSSISRNAAQGAEVYCMTPAGASSTNARGEGTEWSPSAGNRHDSRNMLLAYHVQRAVSQNVADRGVRRARFAVLREATMPAVLIETGFMSHPVESKKIFDPAARKKTAQAIANGILAYRRSVQ